MTGRVFPLFLASFALSYTHASGDKHFTLHNRISMRRNENNHKSQLIGVEVGAAQFQFQSWMLQIRASGRQRELKT
jgi:hypothetical protein